MTLHRPAKKPLLQCPLCKELAILDRFAIQQDTLIIVCSACEKSFAYEATHHPAALIRQDALLSEKNTHNAPSTLSSSLEKTEQELSKTSALSSEKAPNNSNSLSLEEKETTSPPPPNKPSEIEASASEDQFCPKCWEARLPEAASCHKCGLLFANIGVTFQPSAAFRAEAPQLKQLLEEWDALQENWQAREEHERFLQRCVVHGALELAAQLYRRERARRGEDPIITAQIDQLVSLAQQQFLQIQKAQEASKQTVGRFVLLLAILFAGGSVMMLLMRLWP